MEGRTEILYVMEEQKESYLESSQKRRLWRRPARVLIEIVHLSGTKERCVEEGRA